MTIDGEVVRAALGQSACQPFSVNGTIKGSEESGVWVMEMTSPGNLVRSRRLDAKCNQSRREGGGRLQPLRDTSLKGGALKKVTPRGDRSGSDREYPRPGNAGARVMPGLE